jgi:hypothetical protein
LADSVKLRERPDDLQSYLAIITASGAKGLHYRFFREKRFSDDVLRWLVVARDWQAVDNA